VALVSPDYNRKNRDVLYVSVTIFAVFLFAMSVSILSESTLNHDTAAVTDVYGHPYLETVLSAERMNSNMNIFPVFNAVSIK
jgi:hypothetical protein